MCPRFLYRTKDKSSEIIHDNSDKTWSRFAKKYGILKPLKGNSLLTKGKIYLCINA